MMIVTFALANDSAIDHAASLIETSIRGWRIVSNEVKPSESGSRRILTLKPDKNVVHVDPSSTNVLAELIASEQQLGQFLTLETRSNES